MEFCCCSDQTTDKKVIVWALTKDQHSLPKTDLYESKSAASWWLDAVGPVAVGLLNPELGVSNWFYNPGWESSWKKWNRAMRLSQNQNPGSHRVRPTFVSPSSSSLLGGRAGLGLLAGSLGSECDCGTAAVCCVLLLNSTSSPFWASGWLRTSAASSTRMDESAAESEASTRVGQEYLL